MACKIFFSRLLVPWEKKTKKKEKEKKREKGENPPRSILELSSFLAPLCSYLLDAIDPLEKAHLRTDAKCGHFVGASYSKC
jgi:hypothetical protein